MSSLGVSASRPYSRLMGVGGYRGSRVVTNEEMCTLIDSTDEWIQQRTGIVERRWADEGETIEMMSIRAAEDALKMANLDAAQIDTVIISTVSYHHPTPSLACHVAKALGCPDAAAFDISAACAGFSYALTLADSLVRSGAGTYVLIIGAEKISEITNMNDRGTAFLFADGAGAGIVGPSDFPAIGPAVWGSRADMVDVISTDHWWDAAAEGHYPFITMEGQKVYRWATTQISEKVAEAIQAAGLTPDDIDCFIPHQANARIVDAMCRRIHLPESVVISNDIAHMGNASAASIPIAMASMLDNNLVKSSDIALIMGFGAGLVYGGQVLVLP